MKEGISFYQGLFESTGSKITESYNSDGFPNSEELQDYFTELGTLPDEIELEGKKYIQTYYSSNKGKGIVYYTDEEDDNNDIKVFYTLKQVGDDHYKGIESIDGVSDLRE